MPAKMTDAPVALTTEASKKFLNSLIQGKLTMNTTATTTESQELTSLDAEVLLESTMDQLEKVRTLMSTVARLTEDKDIQGLAILAKQLASAMHNDVDVVLHHYAPVKS